MNNPARVRQLSIFRDDAFDQTPQVNPDMLIMARQAAGMTQGELEKACGISQGAISKYESCLLNVKPRALEAIATALRCDPEFFYLPERVHGFGTSCTYHRKQKTMSATPLKKIQASVNMHRIRVARLLNNVDMETETRFFRLDLDEFDGDAEEIARIVRSTWQLPYGPVRNMVEETERAGGIVIRCAFGTKQIDAVSHWVPPAPPVFLVNEEIPTDRLRWSLAHELGHIIMHRIPTEAPEREADRFAAEFLTPASEIRDSLNGLRLDDLKKHKMYWKVSMQAVIRRAHDLKVISDWRYRSLFEEFAKEGHRMKEPVELPPEEPSTLRRLIEAHTKELGYTSAELSRLLFMPEADMYNTYPVGVRPALKLLRD
jgi:Zn-dependent peptidase ImmA (M78 family)